MVKRRNENAQVRKEDYDQLEEKEGIDGENSMQKGFERASEDQIRQRKIVKARHQGSFRQTNKSNNFSNENNVKSNPFQGFGGLASSSAPPEFSVPKPRINPFAAFSINKMNSNTSSTTESPGKTNTTISTSLASNPTSYNQAIEVLNADFFAFISEQLTKAPNADWSESIKDYIVHSEDISIKHSGTKPIPRPQSPTRVSRSKKDSNDKLNTSNIFAKNQNNMGSSSSTSSLVLDKTNSATKQTPSFSFGEKASDNSTKPPAAFSFGAKSTDSSSKPTGEFSFGAKPADNSANPPTSLSLEEKSTDSSSKPSAAFSFGAKPAESITAPTKSTFGGELSMSTNKPPVFSFGASSSSSFSSSNQSQAKPFSFALPSSSTPSATAQQATSNEDDEETIGREEPTVIIKVDNPDEDVSFETEKCKVLEFIKDENRWADKGVHPLKVLVHKTTKAGRMLIRNSIGKIVLNAALYKGLKVKPFETKGKKVGVQLSLQVGEDAIIPFILKVKSEFVQEFIQALEAGIAKD